LQIWDTPSNFELEQLDVPLGSFVTIVYVMDMQVGPFGWQAFLI
jgi:Ras-related GTP-binding protein C/D